MKDLFSDAGAEESIQPTPSGELATAAGSSGLYLSDPKEAGKTQMSVILSRINTPWRSLGVGSVAAALLVGLGWVMAECGARRPLAARPVADPVAALPIQDD